MENKVINSEMFLSVPLSTIQGNTPLLKRVLVNLLLNPNFPIEAIKRLLKKVIAENFSTEVVNTIIDKTKVQDQVLLNMDKAAIANRICTWENIFGKLSSKDWTMLFEEEPYLMKIFPEKNSITPISLAKLITLKVKGQLQPMLKLSLYLYEFVTYWNNSIKGGAALKPLNSRLIIGESGSGKTYSIHTAASYLNAGIINIDASRLTSEGIVGQKLTTEMIHQFKALPSEIRHTNRVIVFIDEIDKLCNTNSLEVKRSVLDELLMVLDGATNSIRGNESYSRDSNIIDLDISSWCFVLGGAFTGIRKSEQRSNVGFNSTSNEQLSSKAISLQDIIYFGMPKEIVGRIGGVIELNKITSDSLIDILKNAPQSPYHYYQKFFETAGNSLILSDEDLVKIANKAIVQNIGVRGLYGVMNEYLEEKMLELFQ
jgi:ATP-dependent protease Clp ATPase subunit